MSKMMMNNQEYLELKTSALGIEKAMKEVADAARKVGESSNKIGDAAQKISKEVESVTQTVKQVPEMANSTVYFSGAKDGCIATTSLLLVIYWLVEKLKRK